MKADFSEPSLAALQCASSLAAESSATLTLLHVLEWPWEEPPAPRLEELPAEQAAALAAYRRHREEAALKRLADHIDLLQVIYGGLCKTQSAAGAVPV